MSELLTSRGSPTVKRLKLSVAVCTRRLLVWRASAPRLWEKRASREAASTRAWGASTYCDCGCWVYRYLRRLMCRFAYR